MTTYDLERFVAAQDEGGTYETALAELRAGRKRSHWVWFVLPQLVGLGQSPTARRYGIDGLGEARAYLRHPVLRPRLVTCADVLAGLPQADPAQVLGAVDAMKLRSSMTLFARAADDPGTERSFRAVLDHFFDGAEDERTLELI